MELVGRENELATVARAVAEVRRGAGRALGVLGEAGIGKSALLAAIGERSRAAELLVLEGRAAEHERDVPFAVAIDALDEHVAALHPRRVEALAPDLGAVLPAAAAHASAPPPAAAGAAERFRYHRALRALIEQLARERPVALLLDDLHWADDASVELVLHLLRRPPRAPHLLAFTARPVDPAPRLLDAARAAPACERLDLAPLDHDASLELLAGLPDAALRERVAREAAGNPLFLQELARVARHPEGTLPPTLLAAVGLEVAALAPASRALIDGAAVAGDPFDPELAAAAADLDPDTALVPLDRLVAADLIRPTGDGRSFRFRHPVVRRAVYDAAAPAWRLTAHERAAAALRERGASPAVRAYHVEQSARPGDDDAIALLAEAAAAAADTAPATAARWYAAATRLLPHADVPRRLGLLGPMALALASAGRLEESRRGLLEVLDLLPPAPTPERLALVAACARIESQLGNHAGARRRLLAALEEAAPEDRAALALELAGVATWLGEAREISTWADRAVREATDELLLASAEGRATIGALWQGKGEGVADTLDRAAARLGRLDDAALGARLHLVLYLALSEFSAERFDLASATAARALTIARRTRQGHPVVSLLNLRSQSLVYLLDLDGALRDVQEAEESARLQGPHLLHLALYTRAFVHDWRAEAADARRAADEYRELTPGLEPSNVTRIGLCFLAALHADLDPERCIREIADAAGPRLDGLDNISSSWHFLVLVRAAIAAGRIEDAARWAEHAARRAAPLRLPVSSARAARGRTEVLLARGDAQSAAAEALRAVATVERAPAPLDAADARLLAGRALAAAGERERALAALQRVAADAGRGRAFKLRDAAARELRLLGTRVPARGRRAAGSGELTAREREVAALVARGQSNKQIAAALFVSEKTVEYHLSNAYRKLGVRSRAALAATLARR